MDRPTANDPVRSVTAFDPEMITPRSTVAEAAQRMREANCGALLIDQRDGQLGVITERDIVWALAGHGAEAGDWVTDVMTRDVITVTAEMTIADAAQVMIDAGIRHLVIDDAEHGRRGVVSVRDLLEPLVEGAP